MKLRKMLAIGLMTASVAGATALTASAAGTKVAGWDFEGDNSAWYNGGEGGIYVQSVEHKDVTENGNTFRRLEFDAVSVPQDAQLSSTLELPASTIVLENPIEFKKGQIIKITSQIRCNQIDSAFYMIPGIAMNVPEIAYDNVATKDEMERVTTKDSYGWNRFFNSLYAVNYSNASIGSRVIQSVSGLSPWGFAQEDQIVWSSGKNIAYSTQVAIEKMYPNVWYNVDTYLTIGEDNKIEKIRTVVDNGSLGDCETVVSKDVTLSEQTSLKSLHLYTGIRNEAGVVYTRENVTADFDDINIVVYDNEEEFKVNSVTYNFEGDNSAWYNGGEGNGTKVVNVEHKDVKENGNTFRRLEFDAKNVDHDEQFSSALEYPATTIILDEPVKFENGQIIKISSKIRSNQIASWFRVVPGISINIPKIAYDKESTLAIQRNSSKTEYFWNRSFNNLYYVGNSDGKSYVYHNASGLSPWGNAEEYMVVWGLGCIANSDRVTNVDLKNDTWYEIDTYLTIGEGNKISKVRTVVNDGQLGDVETVLSNDVSLAKYTSLGSIHLYTGIRNEAGSTCTVDDIKTDFDDIEITVYENAEDLGIEPYYIKEDFKFGCTGWTAAEAWNVYTTTLKSEDGVMKISGEDTSTNGQFDLVGAHKSLPVSITPSADKDFVIKTRIRNTCDTATIHFMLNRATYYTDADSWDQARLNTKAFFKITPEDITFRHILSNQMEGYVNQTTCYKGTTLNKWFDVEFYFDSSDKTIYGCVKDEDNNVYSVVSETDWEDVIKSFSIMLVDVDDDTVKDENGNTVTDEAGNAIKEPKPVSCEVASFEFYEVSNAEWVILADENGDKVTEIKAGDNVCAKYNFKPALGDGVIEYYAMVALYSKDENGALKLEKVEVKDLGANMGYYNGSTDTITVPEGGNYVAKAFVWNSATNKPMMENDMK